MRMSNGQCTDGLLISRRRYKEALADPGAGRDLLQHLLMALGSWSEDPVLCSIDRWRENRGRLSEGRNLSNVSAESTQQFRDLGAGAPQPICGRDSLLTFS